MDSYERRSQIIGTRATAVRQMRDECDAGTSHTLFPQAKMKTILVVDEERSIVTAWKRILQLEAYRVLTANNGREGLFAANGEKPDLIITDRSTSIMYGVDFCRHLKLGRKFARTPVILTSADPLDPADATLGDEFLLKPVSMQMLLASVRRLLNPCP
ncbi:two-component system response regulator [Paraburkholderia sp. DGU8]|uniref:response regulator n=1 Tax=Paraburkholderia sp. DGU8 TaxID=3161997 RepID=UPI003465A9A1